MSGIGRKPKPTALKILEGNPGKRPLNENEPEPQVRIPVCPDCLDLPAQQEWARITPLLAELGLLSEIDRTALAGYCDAYGRWYVAQKNLRLRGLVVKKDGKTYMNPFVRVAQDAMKEAMRHLVEFGMTPSSRSRIAIFQPRSPQDDMEALLDE